MDVQELVATLKAHNLHPILVHGTTLQFYKTGLLMIGNLDDFISAVRILDEKAIFVVARTFSDTDFIYEIEKEEQNSLGAVVSRTEEINLQTIEPELENYRSYIGQVCVFKLSVYWKEQLSYVQAESWWDTFQELYDRISDKLDEEENLHKQQRAEVQAQVEQERRADQTATISKVRSLIDDPDFMRMFTRKDATQRAMQAYALEVIPELGELSTELVKIEIQSLSDRLRAKKALGERTKSRSAQNNQAQLWNDQSPTSIFDESE